MRAFSTAAVSLMISLTLFGCDQNHTQTQAPAAAAVAPPPACNCQQAQVAQASAPVVHRHRHHHREWSDGRSYGGGSSSYSDSESYNDGASDNDSSSYDEHSSSYRERSASYSERSSSSVREYHPGDEEQYSDDIQAEDRMTQTANASAGVWVDGYGRAHYPDYGPIEDEHPGLISRKDERKRLHPWHGYDSDCDNGAE